MQTLFTVLAFLLLFATPAGNAAESPAGSSSRAASPVEEFKPSTRLPADMAVAFPVDI